MSLPASIAELPARTAEFGARLVRWAGINSGSRHRAGLDRMRGELRAAFAAFPNCVIEELPCDGSAHALRVSVRPHAPTRVLLNGHFDTVYEATDPFQTCRWLDATTLNGPGVADMKGGLVTLLATLEAFERTPGADQLGWDVLLTPDEETGSHGSAHLFRETPQRVQFALVFEPARPNGDMVHSRKGTGSIVATCHGRAGHAAKVPNDGRNAILGLAEFLLAASEIPRALPGVLVNVGNIRGGSAATNVVPDLAIAELDVRITAGNQREQLLDRLHRLAGEINQREGFRLELTGGFNHPPKECLRQEEALFPAWQRAAVDAGLTPPNWTHAGGSSDGNLLSAAGLPNFDGVGPIGDHLHSDRETVFVPSIATRAQVAALFLHRVASGEIGLT